MVTNAKAHRAHSPPEGQMRRARATFGITPVAITTPNPHTRYQRGLLAVSAEQVQLPGRLQWSSRDAGRRIVRSPGPEEHVTELMNDDRSQRVCVRKER